MADAGAVRTAVELLRDTRGSVSFGGGLTRLTSISREGMRRAWRWARTYRSVGDGPTHRPSGRDLEFAEFRRETFRHQTSPEGVVQDWLRFLRDRPGDARMMYRDGRIDRNWLDPEWIKNRFQQQGNRFIAVLSEDGGVGLAASTRQYLRLGPGGIIQLEYPPEFPR